MYQNERKQLKKLCRELRKNLQEHLDLYSNNELNMVLLSIFAICLLSRRRNKVANQINTISEFIIEFNHEIGLLSERFSGFSQRVHLINIVPVNDIEKIMKFTLSLDHLTDNVLAWCYQYLKFEKEKEVYSSSLKEGKKISGDAIAAATQFFTEDYMVKHLVKNALKNSSVDNLLNLKIIDPACGGGNFLVYALEILFELIHSNHQSKAQLLKDILENILVGYDLDPDLAEIAAINLYLKAASYVSPEELDITPSIYTSQSQRNELGSLLKNDESGTQVKNVTNSSLHLYVSLFEAEGYDLVLTNPPFMGKRNMSNDLLDYLNAKFPASKGDLCVAFIMRCLELAKNDGVIGLVNQTSWMFLQSYNEIRQVVLKQFQIIEIVDLGSNSFVDINGEKTTVALSLIKKSKQTESTVRFVKLKSKSFTEKEHILNAGVYPNRLVYTCDQTSLLKNEGYVFQYESGQAFNRFFKTFPQYKEFATPMQGTSTGDNNQFVDYEWSRKNDPDWVLVSKGGGYSKWCGLNYFKVKWGKEAEFIKQHPGSAIRNLKYMSETDLVFSDTGTQGLSVRLLREGQVFIASGPGIRIHEGNKYAHMAFLNTRSASFFLRLLSPKFTIAAGYIAKLPVKKSILTSERLALIGQNCFLLKQSYLSRKLGNIEYTYPDFSPIYSLNDYLIELINQDLCDELERLRLEAEIEDIIQNEYGFTKKETDEIYFEMGIPVYKIENFNVELNASEWDRLLVSSLNSSCQFVSRAKKKFGAEGILESLSLYLNVHPSAVYEQIKEKLPLMNQLLSIYQSDLLHKATLYLMERKKMPIKTTNELALQLAKIFPNLSNPFLEDWCSNHLWMIHERVFLNRPFLPNLESVNEVGIC